VRNRTAEKETRSDGPTTTELDLPDHEEFLGHVAYLHKMEISALDAEQLRKAVRTLRPVRGWVEHLDALLRTRANELDNAANPCDETTNETDPSSSDDDGRGSENGSQDLIISETVDQESGIGTREGRRRQARAKVLTMFPPLGRLLRGGHISVEHLDAIVGFLASTDPSISEHITDYTDSICHEAARRPADAFRRALGRIGQQIAADLGIERRRQQQLATRLRHWIDGSTGMGRIHGELDPDSYQQFVAILDAEVQRKIQHRGDLHPDRHRALCLLELMTSTTANRSVASPAQGPATALRLDVLIDAKTLISGPHSDTICEYPDGSPVKIADALTAACCAELHPILISGRTLPISVGRTVRAVTPAQRRALRAVYATCAIPGCDTTSVRCDVHHLIPWDQGGPTDLANLIPLCSRHHQLCHEERWQLELSATRTLTITFPDGTVRHAPPDRWLSSQSATKRVLLEADLNEGLAARLNWSDPDQVPQQGPEPPAQRDPNLPLETP
jgi:hypothetical protein